MAQKSILQIVQRIASELTLPTPQVVVSSTDTNIQKLRALVVSACDDLLNECDWQVLNSRYEFTTSDGVESYALPGDINRFKEFSFYDQSNRWPVQGPLNAAEWEFLKVSNLGSSPFTRYRVFQDKLHLHPTPGSSPYTFVYEYVSDWYVQNTNTGARQAEFMQDSDICLFDHRLVVYGAKLKWLASINQDTTAAFADYEKALAFATSRDEPNRKLDIRGRTNQINLLSLCNLPDSNIGL